MDAPASLAGVTHGFFGREGGVSHRHLRRRSTPAPARSDDPASRRRKPPPHRRSVWRARDASRRRASSAFARRRAHRRALARRAPASATRSSPPRPTSRISDPHRRLHARAVRRRASTASSARRTRAGKARSPACSKRPCALMAKHGADPRASPPQSARASTKAVLRSRPRVRSALRRARSRQFARFFTGGAGERRMFDLPALLRQTGSERWAASTASRRCRSTPIPTPPHLFSNRRSVHEKLGDYGRNCAAIMPDGLSRTRPQRDLTLRHETAANRFAPPQNRRSTRSRTPGSRRGPHP